MVYRESPRFLLCPRCTEMLEEIVIGASMCPQCEGVWLTTHTLELAFGDSHWPPGRIMWWHNQLACPECSRTGSATIMDAKSVNGVQLDACGAHGLWLDRGELGRITMSHDDELAELLRRLEANVDPVQLDAKREKWRSDQRSQKEALAAALEAHARATELAAQLKLQEAHRQEVARARYDENVRKLKERDALVKRSLEATAVVTRLEAKIAGLRAELDLRSEELERARNLVVELDKELRS